MQFLVCSSLLGNRIINKNPTCLSWVISLRTMCSNWVFKHYTCMISPPDSPHQLLQTGSQSRNAQSITAISLIQLCFGCHVSPFLLASLARFSPAPKCNVLNPSNMSALTSDWLTEQGIQAVRHPLCFSLWRSLFTMRDGTSYWSHLQEAHE